MSQAGRSRRHTKSVTLGVLHLCFLGLLHFACIVLGDDKSARFKEMSYEASPNLLLAPPTQNHRWLQNKPRTSSLNSNLTLWTQEGKGQRLSKLYGSGLALSFCFDP